MTYQEIQDWADEHASAKMGYGIMDEVIAGIKSAGASYGDYMAIILLSNALVASEQGADVDWDFVTEQCQSLM